MMNPDDLDPTQRKLKPLDLQSLSLEELGEYVVALEAEIARAEAMITKKKHHKSGIEALFGGPAKS